MQDDISSNCILTQGYLPGTEVTPIARREYFTIYTAYYFAACWNMLERIRLHEHTYTQCFVLLSQYQIHALPDHSQNKHDPEQGHGLSVKSVCLCFQSSWKDKRDLFHYPAYTVNQPKYLQAKFSATFYHAATASGSRTSSQEERNAYP